MVLSPCCMGNGYISHRQGLLAAEIVLWVLSSSLREFLVFSRTTGAYNHNIKYSLEQLMLPIQHAKLLPHEAGGESPCMKGG